MPTPIQVHVKIGDIGSTSRTNLPVENARFTLEEGQSFDDFSRLVEDRVKCSLRRYKKKTVRPDLNIYLKPGQASRQRDFVALCESNFMAKMSAAKSNHDRRSQSAGPFVAEIFVFAAKKTNLAGTRRATASRVQEAAQAIDTLLAERPSVHVGEIARTHWSISHARQPEGTEPSIPTSATFVQAQHIDSMRVSDAADTEPTHQTISVSPNGSSEFALTINVAELRRVLGLPNHNLLASGIFSSFVPPAEPEEDISDVDHASD